MRFFSIVPSDDNSEAGIQPDPSIFVEMAKISEEAIRNGTLLAQDGLMPSSAGARVRFTKGDTLVIDGPFTEAKELIAGFAILEQPSLEAMIADAKKLPMKCEIEIRPIIEAADLPGDVEQHVATDQKLRSTPIALSGQRRFMLILKSDAATESGALPNEELLTAMGRYNDQLVAAKALLAGEGLHASSKGARLDLATGKVTRGPFPNPQRLVAGYWIIQAASLADAVAWARKAPIQNGEIEVRTVLELSDMAPECANHFARQTAH